MTIDSWQASSCCTPPLGAPFAGTLSAVHCFLHALLNEMLRVILDPAIRQQQRQLFG
jgi:hypothetical protein